MFEKMFRVGRLLAIVTSLLLLSLSMVSAQNNCNGVVKQADNHDASWGGWDGLISRVQDRGCDYVDIEVDVFAIPASPVSSFEYTVVFRNVGNVTATNFRIYNEIPAEFDAGGGSVNGSGVVFTSIFDCFPDSANIIDCSVESMVPGGQVSIQMNMSVAVPRTATSTVIMIDEPDEGDLDPRNDSDSITIAPQ